MYHFFAIGGGYVVRIKYRILTQVRDNIRARIIAPPLVVRLYAYFAGYDIGVHCCHLFNRKIRIDNTELIPLCKCCKCVLHRRLSRTMDDLAVFAWNPYVRMSPPCDCESV
ncbi:hypothetical protein D3C71_1926390 [compost metagenome]